MRTITAGKYHYPGNGNRNPCRGRLFEADLESGDYILLCSDGLTNMVADERICAIISEPGTLKEKAERLIEEANESGGIDNIAVVLVKFEEGGTGLC